MPESKAIPSIRRLQGGVLFPHNITQVTKENEGGEIETVCLFKQIKLDQHALPGLSEARVIVWRELQKDLHAHIYSHYDQGSQSTVQGYLSRAERLGRLDIVRECEKILDWIDDCLDYYYVRKDEVLASADTEELVQVSWDFTINQPVPDDLLGLREIKEMFV